MSELSLWLRENPIISDVDIRSVLGEFGSWKNGTRTIGGNWQGEGKYTDQDRMRDFFMTSLGRRLVAKSGGRDYWEGPIVRMEYTLDGQTFIRSMEDMTNRTKVIYSKIGDNLLANGDVESGSWLTYGTPATITTTSGWFARGTTAMCVLSDAGSEGAIPASAQTINANQPYVCSTMINVGSGLWTLNVADTATSAIVAQRTSTTCGKTWLQCQVPEGNAITIVDVSILSSTGGEEMFADAAYLRAAAVRSETKWFEDLSSASAYGRKEEIWLKGEMTDDEASAFSQRALTENAWPRTEPGRRGRAAEDRGRGQSLTVTCMGMVWTLTWITALTDGAGQADAHVANLLAESEFFTGTNIVDTNTTEVYLESGNPQHLWRLIEKVTEAGDGAGAQWMAGGYPGSEFRYEARPTATEENTQYRFHNGEMMLFAGGRVPPLEFMPGWCWMSDMPVEPTPAGGAATDDPKRVWLDETWTVWDGESVRLEWSLDRK